MQSLSRLWENVSVRLGRSSQGSATQLQESISGSSGNRDYAEERARDSREVSDQDSAGSQGDSDWAEGPRQWRTGATNSEDGGTLSRGDAAPLLDADDANGTDESGDIDFGDVDDDAYDEQEVSQVRRPENAAADGRGVFNGGFVQEDEFEDGELEEGDWEEGDEDAEEADEFEEDDDDEESSDACFGVEAKSIGQLGTSSIDVATDQRAPPKIVGYLNMEVNFDAKDQSLNVRVLAVELNLALTKFRRKSNKKMRWSQLQICSTMLPDKELKFRTPMIDHADPRKRNLPGASEDKVDGEPADRNKEEHEKDSNNKEGGKVEPKDKDQDKDQDKKEADSKDKKSKKGKKERPAAPSAARERKAAVAAIASRRAAAKKEQEERHKEVQSRMKELQRRLEEERERQAMGMKGIKLVEFKDDVTKFADTWAMEKQKKTDAAAAAAAKGVDIVTDAGKKKGDEKDEDDKTFKFKPVYQHQLSKKTQQPVAIRFRVYGCWRKKRSFLLGENTFALERMEGNLKQAGFKLQLEERRFALSKLKHLSDSEEEDIAKLRKAAAKAKKAKKDVLDAMPPPPTEGPMLVNQGEIFLGLSYNTKNGHLEVEVVKACNLTNPKTDKPPSTYVKIRILFPEKKSPGRVLFKSRTLCIPDSRKPAWNEAFAFPISRSHLNDVSVMAEVYCRHTLPRTISLGWCSIGRNNCSEEALDHWSEMRDAAGKQVSCWHVLLKVSKEKTEGQLDSD